jgi:hypothetical protein
LRFNVLTVHPITTMKKGLAFSPETLLYIHQDTQYNIPTDRSFYIHYNEKFACQGENGLTHSITSAVKNFHSTDVKYLFTVASNPHLELLHLGFPINTFSH